MAASSRSSWVPEAMIRRQRGAVDPLGDEHVVGVDEHVGHEHVVVVAEGGREVPLVAGLEVVVELLAHPRLELVHDRLDVDARHPRPGHPGDPGDLVEVGHQGLGRPRVLDLDGDLAPVAPDPLVHLADRGRGGRHVVELDELGAGPARPELAGQDLVHPVGAHRRPGLLQLGEGGAVGRRRAPPASRPP